MLNIPTRNLPIRFTEPIVINGISISKLYNACGTTNAVVETPTSVEAIAVKKLPNEAVEAIEQRLKTVKL